MLTGQIKNTFPWVLGNSRSLAINKTENGIVWAMCATGLHPLARSDKPGALRGARH